MINNIVIYIYMKCKWACTTSLVGVDVSPL